MVPWIMAVMIIFIFIPAFYASFDSLLEIVPKLRNPWFHYRKNQIV
jgi:hypothetical protein